MDRSLLFFYGLFVVFIGYYLWKAKKQQVLVNSLALLATSGISIILASQIAKTDSGAWWLAVFIFALTLYVGGAILFLAIKSHHGKKQLLAALNVIKSEGAAGLEALLHNDVDSRQGGLTWFVVCMPESKSVEIGANITNQSWALNKKYYLRTLSNRTVCFVPDTILEEVDLHRDGLYALSMFVRHSKVTAELVRHYAEAIKSGVNEPWKCFDDESSSKP